MNREQELSGLTGRRATESEVDELRRIVPDLPDDLIALLLNFPVVGESFSLAEDHDESQRGAELRILTAAESVDEALNAYPGVIARKLGFLPIGICLEGSGDPYFVKCPEGTMTRIPHDSIGADDSLDLREVELVCHSLRDFLKVAEAYGKPKNLTEVDG